MFQMELDKSDSEEYEVEVICNSVVYARELEGHLPGFYYLVSWKGYPEEKNAWEPVSAIQYLWRPATIFYHNYPDKLTAISLLINSTQPMARLIVKHRVEAPSTKQK